MVQARAIQHGLIGPPPKPARVIDLDLTHILALAELILSEHEDTAREMQDAYDEARPLPPLPPVTRGEQRRADIERFRL